MSRDFQIVPVIQNMNSVMSLQGDLITEFVNRPCTDAMELENFGSIGVGHGLAYTNGRCVPQKSAIRKIDDDRPKNSPQNGGHGRHPFNAAGNVSQPSTISCPPKYPMIRAIETRL